MRKKRIAISVGLSILIGCTTNPNTGQTSISNWGKGAGIGAAAGAGAGALFGGNDLKNAGLGALAGAVLGAGIGYYMDKQEEQMQRSLQGTGIEVQRSAENTLSLTMPSNVTFAFDKADLTTEAQNALNAVAQVLNQYPDSTIAVTGHTDDVGSEAYNRRLSELRAASVFTYLAQHGVNPARISQQGIGKNSPKVPNTSDANRAINRRVEMAIVANQNAGTKAPQGNESQGQGYGYPQQSQGGYQQPNNPQGYPQQNYQQQRYQQPTYPYYR